MVRDWLRQQGVDPVRAAYLGNDINDLAPMALVGWPVAVADAHPEVRQAARRVLSRPGGLGPYASCATWCSRRARPPRLDPAPHCWRHRQPKPTTACAQRDPTLTGGSAGRPAARGFGRSAIRVSQVFSAGGWK